MSDDAPATGGFDAKSAREVEAVIPEDAIIRGRDVVKEYQTGDQTVRALKGIDFGIGPGDFVAVVGPSGSGKSTLLNLLGLLDVPTSGTVTLNGEDVAGFDDGERTRKRKQVIGFVFQSFYLIPTLTALENVEMPRMLDRTPKVTRQRATELLERVGLGDRLDHYPDELSGGQKQRVAIARSLINDPDLVLADEPTGNLDRDTGDQILDLFDELRREEGVAVVTVTHDDYVAEAADRVVNLIDGTLRTSGDASHGSADPDAEAVADADTDGVADGDAPAVTDADADRVTDDESGESESATETAVARDGETADGGARTDASADTDDGESTDGGDPG